MPDLVVAIGLNGAYRVGLADRGSGVMDMELSIVENLSVRVASSRGPRMRAILG